MALLEWCVVSWDVTGNLPIVFPNNLKSMESQLGSYYTTMSAMFDEALLFSHNYLCNDFQPALLIQYIYQFCTVAAP